MAQAGREEKRLGSSVARLLREVIAIPDVLFVMGKGPQAVMEGWVQPAGMRVGVNGDWVAVESAPWHCHLDVSSIAGLRFVEEKDVHEPTRQAFSIRFLNRGGEPLLMIFFGKMYDDAGAPRPDRVSLFRGLQGRYASGEAA